MGCDGWKVVKLGEIVDSVSTKPNFRTEKVVLINTSDVLDGKVLNHKYVKNKNLKGQFKKSFQKGDILYSEIRPKNKRFAFVNFDSKNYIASTKLMVLRARDNVKPEFLYNILSSEKIITILQSLAESRSGTFPQITYSELSNLKVKLPSIDEQKLISANLSSINYLISNCTKINQNLEEMAQAIFKHWFVDFEFPNEEGKPYKSSGGEMVESELGMIPLGWNIVKIQSLISVKDGTHNSPRPQPIGYPLITSKHLKNTMLDIDNANKISEHDFIEINKRSKVERYDILISMIGTVGDLFLVQDRDIKFAIKNVGLFKTSERIDLFEYIYYSFKTKWFNQYINERLAGSTQQYISLGELRKIPIRNPDETIIRQFKQLINPILAKIYLNSIEASRLTSIRDNILPKLMSGELRLPVDKHHTN